MRAAWGFTYTFSLPSTPGRLVCLPLTFHADPVKITEIWRPRDV